MLNDLRLALRGFCKSPGFAGMAIVTLALGIGASTAIFSVVNAVLLRPLPYPGAEDLTQVETVNQHGRAVRVSYPDFEDLRDQNHSFAAFAAYAAFTTTASAEGQGFRVDWAEVSADFFSVLGVAPMMGRVFSAEEERAGALVAIVGYGYWRSRLGATASLAGRSIRVGDRDYAVIGVMPEGYDFPSGTELWVPRELVPPELAAGGRTAHNWSVVGRLRDDVSRALAQQDLSAIARRIRQQYGDDTDTTDALVSPLLDQFVGDVRPALLILLGAAGILLLVACVNVANLLLARAFARDRESALRLALGAPPGRLVRIFLAESLVLSLSGAAVGALIALAGVPALLALAPASLPRVESIEDIGVDWPVLAFTLTVAVLAAMLIGLVPALRAARRDLREALAESRRIQGGGTASGRLRAVLVVGQIALTVVLLSGAGLLGRSLQQLLAVDPGFRVDGALIMELWFPLPRDEGANTRIADYIDRLMERLHALPAVERVGGVNYFPLEGGGPDGTFLVLERPDEVESFEDLIGRLTSEPARTGHAEFRVASAGYFAALRIPLIRGRLFDERDTPDAPHVAVISESLAETRWPGEDPLGKLIQFGNMDGDLQPFTIVGIVGDVQDYGIGSRPRPTFYADYRQRPRSAFYFNIAIESRAEGRGALTATAERIARELDAEVPVTFKTLREVVSASLADRQFVLLLLAVFGGLAFMLAAMGVYGVVAYQALQRTPEIGVRVALGARSGDVVRLLVRQGGAFAVAGIGIGLLAALASARVLASLLYGVGTADAATFAGIGATLFAAVIAASWIPAHRASRIDAIEALRHE